MSWNDKEKAADVIERMFRVGERVIAGFFQTACPRNNQMKGSPPDDAEKAAAIVDRLKRAERAICRVLTEKEVQWLINRVSAVFLRESSLIECDPPMVICGDTHGQFSSLLRIFEWCGWPGSGPSARYLFLGNYVNRGKRSVDVMCLLFALKVRYPTDVFLLRGNHECWAISGAFGFRDECKSRYSDNTWRMFNRAFDCMPIAGLVGKRILCVHGGLSPELENLNQIRLLKRPTPMHDTGLLADLLWSNPDPNVQGFQKRHPGVGFSFGEDAVTQKCAELDIDLVARGRQVVHEGYEFFGDGLVTLFSAPDYCGEFGNAAGMMFVDEKMTCKIKRMVPV